MHIHDRNRQVSSFTLNHPRSQSVITVSNTTKGVATAAAATRTLELQVCSIMTTTNQIQRHLHPEDDDLLSSIRTVREIVEQEFSNHSRVDDSSISQRPSDIAGSNGGGVASSSSSPSSWKAQAMQLQQQRYEDRLEFQAKLDRQGEQAQRLRDQLHLAENAVETERSTRSAVESALLAHDELVQALKAQLHEADQGRHALEEKVRDVAAAVREGQASVEEERRGTADLVRTLQQERGRTADRAGREEAGRVRAECQVKEMTDKIQTLQQELAESDTKQQFWKRQFHEAESARKQVESELKMVEEQLPTLQSEARGGEAKQGNDEADRMVQELHVQIKQMKEEKVKGDEESARKIAEMQAAVREQEQFNRQLQEKCDEIESRRNQALRDREKLIDELEVTKRETRTTVPMSTTETKDEEERGKRIQSLENSISKDSHIVHSLEAQIAVMEKAQPSKKVKEGLASKRDELRRKREHHFAIVREMEVLTEQQLAEYYQKSNEARERVGQARTDWLDNNQKLAEALVGEPLDSEGIGVFQTEANRASRAIVTAIEEWQNCSCELMEAATRLANYRSRFADLPDEGEDSAEFQTAPDIVEGGDSYDIGDASNGSGVDATEGNTKRGSHGGGRGSKRQKTK